MERVLEAGLGAYAVELPAGNDPDEHVQEHGGDAFADYVEEHRQDLPSFAYQRARRSGALATPEDRVDVQREIIESVARIPDPNLRREYVAHTSEVTGVPDADLFRMLEEEREQMERRARRRRKREQNRRQALPEEAEASAGEGGVPPERDGAPHSAAEPANGTTEATPTLLPEERVLFRLMLENGGRMVGLVLGHMALDEFTEGAPRDLARTFAEMYEDGTVRPQQILGGEHGEELQQLGAAVMMDEHEASEHWAQKEDIPVPHLNDRPYEAARSAMKFLKMDRVDEAIEAVRERMYQASQQGANEQVERLQQKMMSLQELRKNIERGAFLDD
jgi:DNA primase